MTATENKAALVSTETPETETLMTNPIAETPTEPAVLADEPFDDNEPMFSMEAAIADILQESAEDKNAPFRPDNLRVLVQLQTEDPSVYEKLRDDLQKNKVAVGRLDTAVAAYKKSMKAQTTAGAKSQTNDLLDIASVAEYFRDADDIPFADIIDERGYRQTWSVTGDGFRKWLRGEYYKKCKASISGDVFKTTIATLAARAQTEGVVRPVAIRCGQLDEKIYIDLCNDEWQAVEVSIEGVRVVDNPPLRFRRRRGMKSLPTPDLDGNIKELLSFLNLRNEKSFVLIVSWLLTALSGHGPFPVLIVVGEQGTAKSTLMSLLRELVDPNAAPLRTLPREVRDLFIAANSAWCLAFDNLSNMKDWISDALCRLATGGGFATRVLYTDEDEMLFNAMRPMMLNGIENVAPRGDLIDRAIVLMLEPIPEERRKTAKEIQVAFDAARPRILGALCKAMAHGLRMLPETKLDAPPRMADFALWASACETSAWPKGTFMAAYEANRAEANEDVLAASLVASTVCDLMQDKTEWEDTATNLLSALMPFLPDDKLIFNAKLWPSTGRVLSERLRREASALRKVGIEVDYKRGKGRIRHIRLSRAPIGGKPATSATTTALQNDDVVVETVAEPEASAKIKGKAKDADLPKHQRKGQYNPYLKGAQGRKGRRNAAD